jgi:hypothetical protein
MNRLAGSNPAPSAIYPFSAISDLEVVTEALPARTVIAERLGAPED